MEIEVLITMLEDLLAVLRDQSIKIKDLEKKIISISQMPINSITIPNGYGAQTTNKKKDLV